MKIGLVVDDTLDKPDGVQQYVLLLGKWLSEQGHEVHYLVGQTARTDIPNIHSLSRNVSVRFNHNKLSIPLPTPRKKIKALLEAEQFDVLHIQMPYSPFMAGRVIAAAPKKTAIIGTFHILPFSRFEAFATKVLGVILGSTLRRFSKVLAVSSTAARFASQSFGVHPEVLPNMINVQFFRDHAVPRKPDAPFTITFLGRLVPRKGALELLKAVHALPEETKQKLRVVICGKGELRPVLERYVRRNHLENIVHIEGFVPEDQKPAYLSTADIAVFPSLGGESFGIVLVEGMAAGSGVAMGGDNQGYRTVLGRWPETLCTPQDTLRFAGQLQEMITNTALRSRIHTEQQEAVNAYDVSVVGTKILDIYRQYIA